jgi:hypothetical protein
MTNAERKIQRIKQQIFKLGHILPGRISQQYNICGKANCQCKDPKHPIKHGPYYHLSFSIGGKTSSMFLKEEQLSEAERWIHNYKELKDLVIQLVQAHVELARSGGLGENK